jgi:hypothetical protein
MKVFPVDEALRKFSLWINFVHSGTKAFALSEHCWRTVTAQTETLFPR